MLLRELSTSRIASERPESAPGFGLEDVNTHGFDPFSLQDSPVQRGPSNSAPQKNCPRAVNSHRHAPPPPLALGGGHPRVTGLSQALQLFLGAADAAPFFSMARRPVHLG